MNKKDLACAYDIGEIYEFDYTSTSDKHDNRPKRCVQMTEEMVHDVQKYLRENKASIKEKAIRQYDLAKDIASTKDAELKASLKETYNEMFRHSADEKTPERLAQDLFIRQYKEEGMSEGNKIRAIYAGRRVTVTGKIGDQWYVISPAHVVETYLTEDVAPLVTTIEE